MNSHSSPPPVPEKSKSRWTMPIVILILACLPPVIAIAWFVHYRTSESSAVERYETEIKERREPLTLTDLAAMYPPIPDDENGAAALLRIWEQDNPAFWAAFREGKATLPNRTSPRYAAALPFLGSDAKHVPRSKALPPASIAAAESYLAEYKDHIAAVRAALRYPQFRFPVQITNGFFALLPHLSELRREAEVFRIDSLMAVEHGDVDGAIRDLEDEARVGSALAREPFLISQLVRRACYSMVLDDMERLLSRRSLSTGQLERLETVLNQTQMPGALRRSLMGERAADLSVFSLPPESFAKLGRSTGEDSEDTSADGARLVKGFLSASGMKDADKLLLLKTFGQAMAVAERDDPRAMRQWEATFTNAMAEASRFPPKLFSMMLLPSLTGMMSRFAAFEARRRAAMVGLAVERYRLDHDGHLPERLEDLVPKYLSDIPLDPFDGKGLRFRPRTAGFVVYSIGVDGIDNGGKERPQRGRAKNFDETFVVER